MDINEVIDHFGSRSATAEALQRSKQLIYYWEKRKEIPLIQQCYIEHVTSGELKADTSDLPFDLVVK